LAKEVVSLNVPWPKLWTAGSPSVGEKMKTGSGKERGVPLQLSFDSKTISFNGDLPVSLQCLVKKSFGT